MILHGNVAHNPLWQIKGILIMHGWQPGEGSGWKHMSFRPVF